MMGEGEEAGGAGVGEKVGNRNSCKYGDYENIKLLIGFVSLCIYMVHPDSPS